MAIAKQISAKEFLMANTSNIDSMRHGRPQTVMFKQTQLEATGGVTHNCRIVTLGATLELNPAFGQKFDHVHEVTMPAATDSLVGKYIIVAPEINVEQYRRIDNCIAKFALVEEETYTAYELVKGDRIEYSEAYLAGDIPSVGAGLSIDANGKLAATQDGPLRVVSVRYQRLPIMLAGGNDANRNTQINGQPVPLPAVMPDAVAMIKVEVVQ